MKTEKTAAEISAEKIKTMPLDPEYLEVADLPIPLHNGVLVKEVTKKATFLTAGGIIYDPKNNAENVEDDYEGIICAVGPKCSEFLRVGLRCQLSSMVNTYFWHKGIKYWKLDEYHVYFIVPDPSTIIQNGYKDAKEVKRAKHIIKDKSMQERLAVRDANEKDQYKESIKKKVSYTLIKKK